MVTKDLTNFLGPCHKVLSGSTRLKINREREGAWLKNSSVGRGFGGQRRRAQRRYQSLVEGEFAGQGGRR